MRDLHDAAHTWEMSVQLDWIPRADDFAARLVLIRHEMGWNLKEAALACGIRAQSWREWELEHRKPRDYEKICHQISDQSGCNLVWLMTGIRPSSPDGYRNGPGGKPTRAEIRSSLLPRLDSNQEPSDSTLPFELPGMPLQICA